MTTPIAYTKIKIISLALVCIGKGPINSIADAGTFAEAAGDIYDLLYPSLLTNGSWRFAVKIQELSQNITDPIIDSWSYSWQLPADYLELIRLDPFIDYNIFGKNIYTKTTATNLYAIYYYQPLESVLPPYFVRHFVYQLAADMAWGLARDKNLSKVYEQKANEALMIGQAADARSHPNSAIFNAPYINVRKGNGRRLYRGYQ
jgi:hypothetical protein